MRRTALTLIRFAPVAALAEVRAADGGRLPATALVEAPRRVLASWPEAAP